MKKIIILLITYITLVFVFTACGKDATKQKPSDESVTLDNMLESTMPGEPELKAEVEMKTIGYAPLPSGWTEVISEQCSRLYSETGLAAIVMRKITLSNEASFEDITDMETYVKNSMSIQCVLKSSESLKSEYGNIVNKIVVGAGETQEVEEVHYVVISSDGDVVVDVVVVDVNYMEELETFARHVSIR